MDRETLPVQGQLRRVWLINKESRKCAKEETWGEYNSTPLYIHNLHTYKMCQAFKPKHT